MRAVLQDRSILHYVTPEEGKFLDQLSASLTDISRQEVERRWLSALGSAFLCVSPSSGLSVSNVSKSLPEFDGKDKRVGALLAALHESEVITLTTEGAQPEIFLSDSLMERLEDCELAEKLKNPRREPIPFPFVVRERQRLDEAVIPTKDNPGGRRLEVVANEVKPARRPLVMVPRVKREPSSVSSTDERREGNKAGREVRDRILRVFESAQSLKMGELMAALDDLHLSDANVRYHVDLLCEKGVLARTGRGRGALICRSGDGREVLSSVSD
jgi:CheY-like chemotaxis protein